MTAIHPAIELARDHRVTCRTYHRLGYHRLVRGAYGKPIPTDPDDARAARRAAWLGKVRAVMALYEDDDPVLYGVTALQVMGVDLPGRLEDWTHVHILVRGPGERPRRRDVIAHSSIIPVPVWRRVGGLPVQHPVDHWLQIPAATKDELIQIGDGFVRRRSPLLTPDGMTRRLSELGRTRGVARARQAMTMVRAGTDSIAETRTRLTLIHGGLPEPAVNPPVWCQAVGVEYHVDMGYDYAKLAVEYDGRDHGIDPQQMAIDADRRRNLQDEGWLIITVTAAQLARPAGMLRSVENALILRSTPARLRR